MHQFPVLPATLFHGLSDPPSELDSPDGRKNASCNYFRSSMQPLLDGCNWQVTLVTSTERTPLACGYGSGKISFTFQSLAPNQFWFLKNPPSSSNERRVFCFALNAVKKYELVSQTRDAVVGFGDFSDYGFPYWRIRTHCPYLAEPPSDGVQ